MIRKLYSVAKYKKFNPPRTMPQTGCHARSARAERGNKKTPVRCADAPSPGLLRLLAQDCYLDFAALICCLDSWWVLQGSNL
ncbi:hypothetical protein PV003_19840 [Bordetella pertussis]|uniref:hypothetical protein n=1 Tax=Bordetella pertussis TaxID=520 RepID=UPI0028E9CC4B|nr:hypothetical protein [Bordetella pertussis]WNQ94637.1 hypothetical protein PV003_19840 [Bordetella pertussis]